MGINFLAIVKNVLRAWFPFGKNMLRGLAFVWFVKKNALSDFKDKRGAKQYLYSSSTKSRSKVLFSTNMSKTETKK